MLAIVVGGVVLAWPEAGLDSLSGLSAGVVGPTAIALACLCWGIDNNLTRKVSNADVGIGFWVWDEWNNLKVEHIIIAIFVIGIVGLILEQILLFLAKQLHTES